MNKFLEELTILDIKESEPSIELLQGIRIMSKELKAQDREIERLLNTDEILKQIALEQLAIFELEQRINVLQEDIKERQDIIMELVNNYKSISVDEKLVSEPKD